MIKLPKLAKFVNKVIYQLKSNKCVCDLQTSRANQWTRYIRVYIQFE